MSTYFISDLHLSTERPGTIEVFKSFLRGPARRAEALYILGDLFEAWVGDDDDSPLSRQVVAELAEYTQAGNRAFFTHGNRDFLIGSVFAQQTGCTLLPEHQVIDLYGCRTLVMHGDLLCTDDVAYLAMRKQLHDKLWQSAFLAKSLPERWALAQQLRAQSRSAMATKAEYIMDANTGAIANTIASFGVRELIHGHTHRPGTHSLEVEGQSVRRIVLGDWYEQDSVLVCDGDSRALMRVSQLE